MGVEKLEKLEHVLRRLIGGGAENIAKQVLDSKEPRMVELNIRQLDDGTKADGSSLPPYTPYSAQIKREKGQQTQPMNLEDTGDYKAAFKVKRFGNKKEIQSDDWKSAMLNDRYGEVEGLTDENVQVIRDEMVPEIDKELKKFLGI